MRFACVGRCLMIVWNRADPLSTAVTSSFLCFRFRLGGLVQLRSDELLSDIDAIDLHSGEAQDWEHKFHIVDGDWIWTHGAFGLGECSAMDVLTDLGFHSGFRVETHRPSKRTKRALQRNLSLTSRGHSSQASRRKSQSEVQGNLSR